MNINLATIDFAPGNGGGGGGSITPEEQAALDILVNSSEGVLYTKVNGAYSVTEKQMSAPNISESYSFLEVIGGDVYYTYQDSLWKYDSDLQDFVQVGGYFGMELKPIWKDNSGRIYSGYDYQLDIENVSWTFIQQTTGYDLRYAWSNYNRTNIFIGNKGIYNLNNSSWSWSATKSYKFKEDTQTFNTGQTVTGDVNQAVRLIPWFKYKDHYLFSYIGNIYEISEGDDEVLTTSNVDGTYFTSITLSSGRSINDFNYFVKGGILYYLDADDQGNDNTVLYVYNEDTESWDDHELDAKLELGRFFVSGDFLISPDINHSTMCLVYLGSTTSVDTSWKNVASLAVDLTSDQQIYGSKSFENIAVENLNVGGVNFKYYDKIFDLGHTTLMGNNLEVNISNVTINDKVPATRDMCIMNRIVVSPGVNFEDICVIPRYSGYINIDQNWKMWYKVPSGDIFYINDYRDYAYKYDSINNEFVTVNTISNKIVSSHRAVLNQGTELWISKDGSVYRWNNTSEDFDFIISTPDSGDWIWQADDTTLRYKDMYVLTYDSGTSTYIWDQVLTAPTFSECYSYILNGQIYMYVPYMNAFYTWDESTGQENFIEYLGAYPQDGDYLALVNGYFYYYANSNEIRRINVYETGENFDTWTNIPSGKGSGQNYPPIFEYNGKYCTERNYNGDEQFCYTYDESYVKPEVDTSVDGTYTLKATVLNGQVTYSWVLDQPPI